MKSRLGEDPEVAWSGCPRTAKREQSVCPVWADTECSFPLSPDLSLLIYKWVHLQPSLLGPRGSQGSLTRPGGSQNHADRWQTEEVTEAEEKATYRGSLTGLGQNQGCCTDVYVCVSACIDMLDGP